MRVPIYRVNFLRRHPGVSISLHADGVLDLSHCPKGS
jgi:hypothetical protein